ncbi:GPP34 family phosphoprotein [Streptomyces sp. NPDC102462]|uniref:GPP34 family phosphoprotein n=1 Tax=Streptomyces sp. NPDC102462 TaxID=3366178 RepID=UPI003803545B
MTTPRDLLIVALAPAADRSVGQGDLSLALAGAELIDLLRAEAIGLDGDRIVPGLPLGMGDPLLDEAVSALVRERPYESVEDWLWRRGRDLAAAYLDALEAAGEGGGRGRGRRLSLRTDRTRLGDTAERGRAAERWTAAEPVLAALGAAVGLREEPAGGPAGLPDTVVSVLAAVNDAVVELEAVRQRRSIETAAFDNIWRAP